MVPDKYKLHAHHWLILHGRYICVARTPRCPDCVVADLCRYTEKTQPAGKKPEVEKSLLRKALTASARTRARRTPAR